MAKSILKADVILPEFGSDKIKHFIGGCILGAATCITNQNIIGLSISSTLFISKEVIDKYKPNPTGFDKMDLLADYIGFFVGYGLAAFIKNLL